MTQFQEKFEVFWEKKDSISATFIEQLLLHSIEEVFPGSFLFSLPGSECEKDKKGFSFFDLSGVFAKVIVMDVANQYELEAILEMHVMFKREAETFFKERGSRIFRQGIEMRLVLLATSFQPEFIQYLHFAGVKAWLVRFSFIEGRGRKGILLRWVEEKEKKPHNGDEQGFLVAEEERGTSRFFFEEVPLSSEERNTLERLSLLARKIGPTSLPPENP